MQTNATLLCFSCTTWFIISWYSPCFYIDADFLVYWNYKMLTVYQYRSLGKHLTFGGFLTGFSSSAWWLLKPCSHPLLVWVADVQSEFSLYSAVQGEWFREMPGSWMITEDTGGWCTQWVHPRVTLTSQVWSPKWSVGSPAEKQPKWTLLGLFQLIY